MEAAGQAKDLVVYVGGLNGTFNYAEGEGTKHDRSSVMLLGQQEALMIATHAAAKKAATTDNNNGPGRVVAVLGLLHVNGVAQRLLSGDNKDAENSSVTFVP